LYMAWGSHEAMEEEKGIEVIPLMHSCSLLLSAPRATCAVVVALGVWSGWMCGCGCGCGSGG
jgi:hypothetical protein